jgi:hypothetical protein
MGETTSHPAARDATTSTLQIVLVLVIDSLWQKAINPAASITFLMEFNDSGQKGNRVLALVLDSHFCVEWKNLFGPISPAFRIEGTR